MIAYPSPRAGIVAIALIGLATAAYAVPVLLNVAIVGTGVAVLIAIFDLTLTSRELKGKVRLMREFPSTVTVGRPRHGFHRITNGSRLPVKARIFEDSDPFIDKQHSQKWQAIAPRGEHESGLRAVFNQRGEQDMMGASLRVLAGLKLWVIQYRFDWPGVVRVYPLIEELTRGDLFAHRRKLWGMGQHQSKKFGRGTEFDHLREYTRDDEYRAVNWKATARRGAPVVNQFQVEQSRDLMLLIDCGRLMNTEIAGRPRLDRYLDAAMQLAYVALAQKDRVGLIAFDAEVRKFVPPQRRPRQLDDLVDSMFDLKPRFVESDYARAVTEVKTRQPKRGLTILFTDLVDSVSSRRAVANLRRLARTHLPVVVILDDPVIPQLSIEPTKQLEDAYIKAAAEQFIAEKKRTIKQLQAGGCLIINVAADRLDKAVVNQYLQVKARNML